MPEERAGDRLRLQGTLGPVLHRRGEAESATESRETIVNLTVIASFYKIL